MKKRIFAFTAILGMLALFSENITFAQEECKVLMPTISDSYTGECKKGLAHGEGSAAGIDTYEGSFSKGLPHGTGKYTWKDGRIYEGDWSKGVRDGNGSMIYPRAGEDSILSGIWSKDEYYGKEIIPQYRVTKAQGIARSSIRKVSDVGVGLSVSLYINGSFNTDIEDFFMDVSSGETLMSGNKYVIENATVPYTVSIKYRVWNTMRSQQHDVFFNFIINEPGTFEVTISN